MIVIAVKIFLKSGGGPAFIKATHPLVSETRKEKGHIFFALYSSTENDTDFLLYENWTDKSALDAHMQTAHYIAFSKYIEESGCTAAPLDVKLYTVDD